MKEFQIQWHQSASQLPVLFHANLAASSLATQVVNVTKLPGSTLQLLNRIHAEHYSLSLTELRKEVAKPGFMPSDAHLFAMIRLGCNESFSAVCEEHYPLSPMGNLQMIFQQSKCDVTMPHITALYRLVEMRGGISEIRLHAMPDILEMFVSVKWSMVTRQLTNNQPRSHGIDEERGDTAVSIIPKRRPRPDSLPRYNEQLSR
jgi:hypothetical protein